MVFEILYSWDSIQNEGVMLGQRNWSSIRCHNLFVLCFSTKINFTIIKSLQGKNEYTLVRKLILLVHFKVTDLMVCVLHTVVLSHLTDLKLGDGSSPD